MTRIISKIYTHANCNDGLGVFLLARDIMPEVEVVFVQHGTDALKNLVPHEGALFADMSPHPETAHAWVPFDPIVLDHHVHAKAVVEMFPRGRFENDQCGTMLFLNFLTKSSILPPISVDAGLSYLGFAILIDVIDRHVIDSEHWEEATHLAATLGKLGPVICKGCTLAEIANFAVRFGPQLQADQQKQADRIIASTGVHIELFGMKVIVAGAALFLSGMVLDQSGADVVALYELRSHNVDGKAVPRYQFSVRAKDKDVGSLCKKLGGGGHKKAAGFSINARKSHYFVDAEQFFLNSFIDWAEEEAAKGQQA